MQKVKRLLILNISVYTLFVLMLFLLSHWIPLFVIPIVHILIAIYCLLHDCIVLHQVSGSNKLNGKYVCYTVDTYGKISRHFTGGGVLCFTAYIRAVSMIIPMINVETGGDYDNE